MSALSIHSSYTVAQTSERSSPMSRTSGKIMRKSGAVSTKVGGTTTKVGGIDFGLCSLEWRSVWPVKTAENVAAFYGCPVRTAENWLSGNSEPSGHWSGIIFNRSGAEFLARVIPYPDEWIVSAARAEKKVRLDREYAAVRAEMAAEGFVVGEEAA